MCDLAITFPWPFNMHVLSITDPGTTNTAIIRTIGSLLVKVYLSDPWSLSPCTESNVMSQGQTDRKINCVSTSPSVYANFHGIHAIDQCGGVFVSSTMVASPLESWQQLLGLLGMRMELDLVL